MSARSAVAGTATVGVLVGVLGSPALVDAAQDLAERHRMPLTAATFTDIPNWDVFDSGTTAEVVWGVVLKLAVLFVVVGLLTALAGRASHGAAFLAGWGSLVVAAGIAGAVDYAYREGVVGSAQNPFGVSYFDNLLGATNVGAGFGLWTGWVVGAAVAVAASLGTRAVLAPMATGPIARSPGRAPITPPAPWWAADTSPSSPLAYDAASVFPQVAQEGPPMADAGAGGTRGDLDLNSTLSTPLARVGDDIEGTRPIPAVDATAPSAAVTDPTVVKPALANPTVDPGTTATPRR